MRRFIAYPAMLMLGCVHWLLAGEPLYGCILASIAVIAYILYLIPGKAGLALSSLPNLAGIIVIMTGILRSFEKNVIIGILHLSVLLLIFNRTVTTFNTLFAGREEE